MTPHLGDRVLFRDADGVERAGVVNGIRIKGAWGEVSYDVWLDADAAIASRRRVTRVPASAIVSAPSTPRGPAPTGTAAAAPAADREGER